MSAELRRLDKYELRERLASGGQGEVWKAFDVRLRRFVAIKQLNAHLQNDPDSTARFEREARFIASLRHPNIVRIHDFFQIASTPDSHTSTAYMVMDYVDGITLADYIRTTSRKKQYPSASDIVAIFTAISLALDYAHQQGMVHRDIKPANIMLDRRNPHSRPMGEPILMDFGIAKLQGGSADTTRVLGTPLYVSPEQARGESGDKRSDLYSLGIILYEVMTGLPPFVGESIPAILLRHHMEMPQAPALINPAISPQVSAVILKSIAKDPNDRFSSASAMTRALAETLNVPIPPELLLTPTILAQPADASSAVTSPLAFVPSASDKKTSISPVSLLSRKRPKLFIALVLLLAVLGLGLASYALVASQNRGEAVVGHVVFRSSQNKAGNFDVVDITQLKGIPDGKNYYVWLEPHNSIGIPVSWSFSVHNGNLQPSSYSDPLHTDLLTSTQKTYLFLITRQSTDSSVPAFNLADRLYYARIPQTPSDVNRYDATNYWTFDILPCPSSDDSSNPCRS
jgi:serine/threonine protein kinase